MRINALELRNVRALGQFEARFPSQFTVIVGNNATGKTTILEMLARVLSWWTPQAQALFQGRDARAEIRNGDGEAFRKVHTPSVLAVAGQGPDGEDFFGTHSLPKNRDDMLVSGLTVRQDAWRQLVEADDARPMPLLALFSPYRDPPKGRRPAPRIQRPMTRDEGYEGAFDLWADVQKVTAWFRTYGLAEIQEDRIYSSLDGARNAIVRCLPGCTDIRYMPTYDEVMIKWADGRYEPIWRLSDGYRTMIALVGEMAWRAAKLNPVGDAGRPQNIKGVVLIDELDIHLHPLWQRRVVHALRTTFPGVQFIATTHSPFIVQSMRADEVINLDPLDSMEYWREGIEDIAAEAMGVDDAPRSELYREFERLSDQYMQLVQRLSPASPDVQNIRIELDRIQERLHDNPAVVAVLRAQRIAREAGS